MRATTDRVLSRFLMAAEGDKPKAKRMVMMIGPPAAGKGFFVGESEKDKGSGGTKKYKTDSGEEKETRTGWKLPQSTKGLFKDADIPDRPEADESDNHLRAIQFEESKHHYDTLAAAHKEGKEAFDKAVKDMWYETKDGDRVELGKAAKLSFDDFPDSHKDFFGKANKDFYVSMRGWHDDAKQKNAETGKSKERFKDEARHRFDDAIQSKTEGDSELLVVDSAGEDIDAQDFKGQIESAKRNGYEVSVVFLHPEQADTELSNLFRGKVAGKRMVDQADITNWYKQNEAALKEIQEAQPDNFLHYRKGPPDGDPKKAEAAREKARKLMNSLSDMCKGSEGKTAAVECAEKTEAVKEITGIVFQKAEYQLQKETSWAKTLPAADLPKEPKKSIAKAVSEMNADAEKRAGKPSKGDSGKGDSDEEGKSESKGKSEGEKSKTRTDFLHEVGDQQVANPNPDGRKDRVKIRSLPWEHQKKYYEQWAEKRSASTRRVVARYLTATGMDLPNRVLARYTQTKGS